MSNEHLSRTEHHVITADLPDTSPFPTLSGTCCKGCKRLPKTSCPASPGTASQHNIVLSLPKLWTVVEGAGVVLA